MFKELFKYYKSKTNPPDIDTVLKIPCESSDKIVLKEPKDVDEKIENDIKNLGLIPATKWQIFELTDHAGLYIIKNPFTSSGELFWMKKCLTEYAGPPNKCNLHVHNLLAPSENWWNVCQTEPNGRKELLQKLRWYTLGYHHDWDSKVYSECNRSEFPVELGQLGRCLGLVTGGWEVVPEAAIINYYRMDSTLSGHTDHSEPDLTAPLFSISFGQSAVFLIGGKSLEDKTTPVLLENGDVVVMSGESRLCYHGVPRILKTDWPQDGDTAISSYLASSRININLRQVLPPGQLSLPN